MRRAIILPDTCRNCETCLVEANCVNLAIIRECKEDKPWVDFYKCRGCMKCFNYCQNSAVGEVTHPCNGSPSQGW